MVVFALLSIYLLFGYTDKMFEEADKVDLSPLEKISSASSPKEFAEAMCAVDKMVNRLAAASNAYGGKTMKDLGVDDVVSVTGLAIGKKVGTKLESKASILGGLILIAIGLEIWLKGIL